MEITINLDFLDSLGNLSIHQVFDLFLNIASCYGIFLFCRSFCRCCWRCCCSGGREVRSVSDGAAASVNVDDKEVPLEHLRRRKSLWTAYTLWLFAGAVGTHHFYLDRLVHGVVAVWSGNFFLIGWMFDGVLMAAYVRSANREAAPVSMPDRSFRNLCCRLPVVGIVSLSCIIYVLISTPRRLHDLGVVDVERGMTGLAENPYDILGVPRGTSKEAAMDAYKEQMRRLQSQMPCNAECIAKRKNLTKVRDFLDGSLWRMELDAEGDADRNEESPWVDWSDFIAAEWKGLSNDCRVYFGKEREDGNELFQERKTKKRKSQRERPGSPAPPPVVEKSRKGPRRRSGKGRGSRDDL